MIYNNKLVVRQRKTKALFVADKYFPVLNDTVVLTNTSVESDSDLWTVNDGVDVTAPTTKNVSFVVKAADPIMQILKTSNMAGENTYQKYLFPMPALSIVYSSIQVSKECARVGDVVVISALDYNVVDGVTTAYQFKIYNGTTLIDTLTNKTNNYSFGIIGVFDIVLEVNTNGGVVKQTIKKLVTVTPALPDISEAIVCELTPIVAGGGRQIFGDSAILPGSTIVVRVPSTHNSDNIYRLVFEDLTGTAENPIVITIDSTSQIVVNFQSYWGLSFSGCKHVIFDGKGYNNLEHGYHISKNDATEEALVGIAVGYLCSDIQLFGIEVSKCTFAGLQAKTDPDADTPATWRENYVFYNFLLHHNYFHDTLAEGNYIGYFDCGVHTGTNGQGVTVEYRAHELRDAKVYRNKYERTGWDALQINNATGYSEICYNTINFSSIYPEADQASFMSMTLDGAVYNNIMHNSGGVGIQFGTFTGIDVFNNILSNIAQGSAMFFLLSDESTPEQYGTDGNNTTAIINLYNNTAVADGSFFLARNVVQYSNVHVKNNLIKYTGNLFGGQSDEIIALWNAQAEQNFRITDDGTIFEIANIDDGDFNISASSDLIDSGVAFGTNYDIRGFENWFENAKHIGAYSAYRKLGIAAISLSLDSVAINSGVSTTNSKTVSVLYTATGTPTRYMISESPSLAGAVWVDITANPLLFVLSEPDAVKTVYLKLSNSGGTTSSILSATISLLRQKSFLVDLGSSAGFYQSPAVNWNNLYSAGNATPVAVGNTVINLVSSNGESSVYSVTVKTQFSDWEANGAADQTGGYPYSAYRDSFISNSGTFGELTIGGLDPAKHYTIKCMGSRGYSTNRTIYTVNGNSQPLLTLDNIANTVSFNSIIPDGSNQIVVKVEGTAGYDDTHGIISILEIIEHS